MPPLVDADGPAVNSAQVFLNTSTVEEIIEFIVNAHKDDTFDDSDEGSQPLLCFHWQDANRVRELDIKLDATLYEMDQPKICRFEYDYESKTVFLKIADSEFRYQVHMGLSDYIKDVIRKLVFESNDQSFRRLLWSIVDKGWTSLEYDNKLYKQADVSFGRARGLPSMVCEVS